MAGIRSYNVTDHEVWGDAVAHNGGVTQTLTTAIPFSATDSDEIIDTVLTPLVVVGVPVFTLTYASAAGVLTVAVANTAAAGNTATWSLDIKLNRHGRRNP